jgi:peroxin-6
MLSEPTIASTLQDCLKVAQEARKTTGYPLVIIGTTSDVDKIPLSVLGLFKEEFSIDAPAEAERLALLESMLQMDILSPDVSVKNLAVQTAALVAGDLADLCERARKHAVARLLKKKSASWLLEGVASLADIVCGSIDSISTTVAMLAFH